VRFAVANRRIDHELRDRTHIERITSLGLTGQRIVAGSATVDYQLVGAYSDQFDPLTMTTTFRHTNVNFLPNVTATQIDPNNVQANPQNEVLSNYNFLSQLRAINFSMDRDIVGQVNARLPLRASNASTSFLKIGAKFRDKSKGRNRNESTVTSPTTLKMTSYLETGFDLPPYLDGRYDLTPYESQSLVENIPNQITPTITRNHARDAEEFDGTERVTAGYALITPVEAVHPAGHPLRVRRRISSVATSVRSDGTSARSIGTTAGYGVALPGLHLRYAATHPPTSGCVTRTWRGRTTTTPCRTGRRTIARIPSPSATRTSGRRPPGTSMCWRSTTSSRSVSSRRASSTST
jgi:hypothetical protein